MARTVQHGGALSRPESSQGRRAAGAAPTAAIPSPTRSETTSRGRGKALLSDVRFAAFDGAYHFDTRGRVAQWRPVGDAVYDLGKLQRAGQESKTEPLDTAFNSIVEIERFL